MIDNTTTTAQVDKYIASLMTGPKYPDITVQLVGRDGNAFAILGAVQRAMKRAGLPEEEITAFMAEATAGNYDHLLATCMQWVDVA